jgi:hypothetical protein
MTVLWIPSAAVLEVVAAVMAAATGHEEAG